MNGCRLNSGVAPADDRRWLAALCRSSRGFSLIELLVVIGIISVLISLLLPALNRVREQGKRVQCLSNLRQLAVAAEMYCAAYKGSYPPGQYNTGSISYGWDFTEVTDPITRQVTATPGILWMGHTDLAVEQCPSYDRPSTTIGDPYTGYNYNASYIGLIAIGGKVTPAKVQQVAHASTTALFGDGQYYGGTDKYMRAPLDGGPDGLIPYRTAGTQGYRHLKYTNVTYCDGHADSQLDRFTNTNAGEVAVGAGTGFLSNDNSAYDIGYAGTK